MRRAIAVLLAVSMIFGLGGASARAEPAAPASMAAAVTLSENGWSDPAAGVWDAATRTATLSADLTQGIEILSDNLTLDGAGHTVSGSAGYGVSLSGRTGVTVRNLTVRGFTSGVYLNAAVNCIVSHVEATGNGNGIHLEQSAYGNTITGCTAGENSGYGLYLLRSSGNTLSGNQASNNGCYGIYLSQAHLNTLSGNTANGNAYDGIRLYASNSCALTGNSAGANGEYGLRLDSCSGATLSGNTLAGNAYNFRVDAQSEVQYNHTVDTTNTVDGKPIYYVRGESGRIFDGSSNAGTLYLINCSDITLRDLDLRKNGVGALLWGVQRVQIENVQATGNSTGLWLRGCSAGNLSHVSAGNNSYAGIHLENSHNNTLLENTVNGNGYSGVYLQTSNANVLTGTIFLQNANGLVIRSGNNNQICNNSFLHNNAQAAVLSSSGNIFSLPAPVGGNYWSNWTGPNANQDPYVDIPYSFSGCRDDLPWVRDQGWQAPDAIPPTTTAQAAGALGDNGWYVSDVTVTLSAADNEGGSGVRVTEYSLNNAAWTPYASPLTLTQEGAHTVRYRSTDNRDNVEDVRSLVVKIDKAAPHITGAAVSEPNAHGWYRAPVTVHFTASDSASGVATVSPDVVLSTEGRAQSVSGVATDMAGHSATCTVDGIQIDLTAPTVAFAGPSPRANDAGWHNSPVTIVYTATDALSGLLAAAPAGPLRLTGEGAAVSASVTVTDVAGNSATHACPPVKIDYSAPVLAIRTPQQYAVLPLGAKLDFDAADALSGLAGLSATLSDGVNTIPVSSGYQPKAGSYTLTVEAVDAAGNRSREQRNFTVGQRPCTIVAAGLLASPEGSYSPKPAKHGTAVVTLLALIGRNADPAAHLDLLWPAVGLSFRSTRCHSVTLNGSLAEIRGDGEIGGRKGYSFAAYALDDGSGWRAKDCVRVRIWESDSGRVIYDNQPGSAETDPPTVELCIGAVVISDY